MSGTIGSCPPLWIEWGLLLFRGENKTLCCILPFTLFLAVERPLCCLLPLGILLGINGFHRRGWLRRGWLWDEYLICWWRSDGKDFRLAHSCAHNTHGLCAHPQVVFWGAPVGNLHSGRLPISWRACGGAFQAAEGGSSHGQAQQLHQRAVSMRRCPKSPVGPWGGFAGKRKKGVFSWRNSHSSHSSSSISCLTSPLTRFRPWPYNPAAGTWWCGTVGMQYPLRDLPSSSWWKTWTALWPWPPTRWGCPVPALLSSSLRCVSVNWTAAGRRVLIRRSSLSPVTGVSGPVNAPGPILSQLSRHPKLYLLLGGRFCLLSWAFAWGALSAPTPSPACQWRTQTTLTSTPPLPSPNSIISCNAPITPHRTHCLPFAPSLLAGASCLPEAFTPLISPLPPPPLNLLMRERSREAGTGWWPLRSLPMVDQDPSLPPGTAWRGGSGR